MILLRIFFVVLVLWTNITFAKNPDVYQGDKPNVELRISVNQHTFLGEREIEKLPLKDEKEVMKTVEENSIPIIRGESIQLKVELIDPDGTVTDVTDSAETFYDALGKIDLETNSTGLVTALASHDKDTWIGKVFIIYGTSEKSGYNKIYFNIMQPDI